MTGEINHKSPPHNIEAEQSLLGGTMLLGSLPPDIGVRPEWFYRAAHRTVFSIMLDLDARGQGIDSVTLTNALRDKKEIEEVGGASYIAHLMDRTPSQSLESLTNYAKIVREKAARRAAISLLRGSMELVADEGRAIEDTIAQISSDLANIEYSGTTDRFKDMRTLAKEGLKRIEARAEHRDYVNGIPTPFGELNKLTNGMQASDLIILAGRPSMGKSAMGWQIAEHVAQEAGPVVIFSLEMDSESLMDRSFASRAQVPSQKIRSGRLQADDWSRLVQAAGNLADLPILTNDSPTLTAQQVRFLARQAKTKMGGLALVVIDYLQLIRTDKRESQRYLEVGEITRTLKQLAREMKAPVFLLSQLNRLCETRKNKRPLLSDLRESGDIEQDADLVMFIYRDEYYCPFCSEGQKSKCRKGHEGLAELLVRKHRKGPTGTVTLRWQGWYTRFEDKEAD